MVGYDQGMRKSLALAAVSLLALTGCASAANAAPSMEDSIRDIALYANMTDERIAETHAGLCRHFEAGYTKDDSVEINRKMVGAESAEQWAKFIDISQAHDC